MKRAIIQTGIGLMLGLLGVMILIQNVYSEWAGIVWFIGLAVIISGYAEEPSKTPPKQ